MKAETRLTNLRLELNDWVSCSTQEQLERWRDIQQRVINCAKVVGVLQAYPAPKWVVIVGKASWAKCHGPFASYDDCIDWAKRNQFTEADSYQAYPINGTDDD